MLDSAATLKSAADPVNGKSPSPEEETSEEKKSAAAEVAAAAEEDDEEEAHVEDDEGLCVICFQVRMRCK